MRSTEWRPRHAAWQFGSHGGAAIGELIVRRDHIRMRWEDQELNHEVPENKFPEVFFAGLFLLVSASKQQGSFLRIDQQALDQMIEKDDLMKKAQGCRIDRLCLYYRLSCRLGPGGDHYPVLGTTHFWEESESHYAILYISPQNDWFHIMVLAGEAPNL